MTNLRVIGVAPVGEKADKQLIEYLEMTLADARSGRLKGAMVIAEDDEGVTYSVAGITDRFRTLGFLMHAIHKLNANL